MMINPIILATAFVVTIGQADYAKLQSIKPTQYAKAPGYSEGPTWKNGELFFCSGSLLRVSREGKVEKFLDINPAGTVLNAKGHLLICDNKNKAILDFAPDGSLNVLADAFENKPLNSLNDLTIDARGNIYWTDPSGSSLQKPVGNIFRLTPKGDVTRIATGLAFPNGLDVDPQGKFLYVIESQSKKILRYLIPDEGKSFAEPEFFYDLGGSGGDGCAFDNQGNLWVADFQRPETKQGRILVLSPEKKVLGHVDIPAQVVSNIAFGGPNHDEIFCSTGGPNGIFHARVGIQGFKGHPGVENKILRKVPISPEGAASVIHPRKFGVPGGIGTTRGWYIWKSFDPDTMTANVTRESSDEIIKTRVLPWATTYRYLVYGASPSDLLPGERVNLFFNADENHPRGYLVHYQDELCQMKGHNHIWEVTEDAVEGKTFNARVLADKKPFDNNIAEFNISPDCKKWKQGKLVDTLAMKKGDTFYLTWCLRDKQKVVMQIADEASLEEVKAGQMALVNSRLAKMGLEGYIDGVDGKNVSFTVYSTYWSQASQLKPGQMVQIITPPEKGKPPVEINLKVISQKNRGTYGSGFNEVALETTRDADTAILSRLENIQGIRIVPSKSK